MIVRRYTGTDLDYIQQTIVRELGDQAVIVHTARKKGKGFLGLGTRTLFEVKAAAEDAAIPATPQNQVRTSDETGDSDLLDQTRRHYRGIRHALRLLDDRLDDVDQRMLGLLPAAPAGHLASNPLDNVHDAWRAELARTAAQARENSDSKEAPAPDWHRALAEMLPVGDGVTDQPRAENDTPNVYVFVGPTGVGKTTTLAKLASRCVLQNRQRVGLISLDTFRLGAVEQLREYAELLGADLRVAESADQLQRHVDDFADKDVVFVDTPGRSQFDGPGIRAIADVITDIRHSRVLLHAPASVREVAAATIVDKYRVLNPAALIITKTDEAVRCDGLTRLFDSAGRLPAVYLTDGQRVPEDIHPARAQALAELIINPDSLKTMPSNTQSDMKLNFAPA